MTKVASKAGQDLRMPILGGTRMPTDGSKAFSQNLLNQSKKSAEVGPAPSISRKTKLKDVVPKLASAEVDMSISEDPLVQYLKKQAAVLEDNESDMALQEEEPELTSEPPGPTSRAEKRGPSEWRAYLDKKFGNASNKTLALKYTAKMKEPKPGVVDAEL